MARSNQPPTRVPISVQPELPHTYLPVPNPYHHMPTPATLICPTTSLSTLSSHTPPNVYLPQPSTSRIHLCPHLHFVPPFIYNPSPMTILPHAYLCHPNTPNHTPTGLATTCPSTGLHAKPKPDPLSASSQLTLPYTYAFHPNPPHVYMAHPNMSCNKPTHAA